MTKIVTTTLLSNNQDIIADAIQSALPYVDNMIFIDTGSKDGTVALARTLAGEKAIVVTYPWPHDFASARNFSLQAALDAGADWAITLDTDERLQLQKGFDLRAHLQQSNAELICCPDETRTYEKERIIRVRRQSQSSWYGAVHECFSGVPAESYASLQTMTFSELPKSDDDFEKKLVRDIAELSKQIARTPNDGRWYFYLGESHRGLKNYDNAVEAYETSVKLMEWAELRAWACYQIGTCYSEQQKFQETIRWCSTGLTYHAGCAELAWLAGWAAYQLNQIQNTIFWENIALTIHKTVGLDLRFRRVSFSNPRGFFEGPHDVLRYAWKQLGRPDLALASEYELANQKDIKKAG